LSFVSNVTGTIDPLTISNPTDYYGTLLYDRSDNSLDVVTGDFDNNLLTMKPNGTWDFMSDVGYIGDDGTYSITVAPEAQSGLLLLSVLCLAVLPKLWVAHINRFKRQITIDEFSV
jgi:hypothetical protein